MWGAKALRNPCKLFRVFISGSWEEQNGGESVKIQVLIVVQLESECWASVVREQMCILYCHCVSLLCLKKGNYSLWQRGIIGVGYVALHDFFRPKFLGEEERAREREGGKGEEKRIAASFYVSKHLSKWRMVAFWEPFLPSSIAKSLSSLFWSLVSLFLKVSTLTKRYAKGMYRLLLHILSLYLLLPIITLFIHQVSAALFVSSKMMAPTPLATTIRNVSLFHCTYNLSWGESYLLHLKNITNNPKM